MVGLRLVGITAGHRPLRFLLLLLVGSVAISAADTAPPPGENGALHVPFLIRTCSSGFPVADNLVIKGTVIELAPDSARGAQCCFDTELLRMAMLWRGGLRLPQRHGGLDGHAQPIGAVHLGCNPVAGWSTDERFVDPRANAQGPLPRSAGRYRGLSMCGSQLILSYDVDGAAVLESPGFTERDGQGIFARTITITAHASDLFMLVCDQPGVVTALDGALARLGDAAGVTVVTVAVGGSAIQVAAGVTAQLQAAAGRIWVRLPASDAVLTFCVGMLHRERMPGESRERCAAQGGATLVAWRDAAVAIDLRTRRPTGPGRWGAPLTTTLMKSTLTNAPYVSDEVSLPVDNPWHQEIQPTGFDFFSDGRMAMCTLSGDVWIISGLDGDHPAWKRFASGLFQPLGLCIWKDGIYVLGRDQITQLLDSDGDGEADRYVCVNNDAIATDNFHDFALDLHMDPHGDFVFGRGSPWPPQVTSPQQGCLIKVTHDGERLTVMGTGLRSPNGLGISATGVVSFSDNPGPWMPACRLNMVRKDGDFWGMKQTSHSAVVPTSFSPPLLWLPHEVDNSPGGQAWCTSADWGPYAGHLLLTSYGMGTLSVVLSDVVQGIDQGGIVQLPVTFPSGIMRIRQSPVDGQMWVAGMLGWQCNATAPGCLARVRYTGAPLYLPIQLHVRSGALALSFQCALDGVSAGDPANWALAQWNYHWNADYGSDDYRPSDDKSGREIVDIASVHLEDDGRTAVLMIPHLHTVMQMQLTGKVRAHDGTEMAVKVVSTINRVP